MKKKFGAIVVCFLASVCMSTLSAQTVPDVTAGLGFESFSGGRDLIWTPTKVYRNLIGNTPTADEVTANGSSIAAVQGIMFDPAGGGDLIWTSARVYRNLIGSTLTADEVTANGSSINGVRGSLFDSVGGRNLIWTASKVYRNLIGSTLTADEVTATGSSIAGVRGIVFDSVGGRDLIWTVSNVYRNLIGNTLAAEEITTTNGVSIAGVQGIVFDPAGGRDLIWTASKVYRNLIGSTLTAEEVTANGSSIAGVQGIVFDPVGGRDLIWTASKVYRNLIGSTLTAEEVTANGSSIAGVQGIVFDRSGGRALIWTASKVYRNLIGSTLTAEEITTTNGVSIAGVQGIVVDAAGGFGGRALVWNPNKVYRYLTGSTLTAEEITANSGSIVGVQGIVFDPGASEDLIWTTAKAYHNFVGSTLTANEVMAGGVSVSGVQAIVFDTYGGYALIHTPGKVYRYSYPTPLTAQEVLESGGASLFSYSPALVTNVQVVVHHSSYYGPPGAGVVGSPAITPGGFLGSAVAATKVSASGAPAPHITIVGGSPGPNTSFLLGPDPFSGVVAGNSMKLLAVAGGNRPPQLSGIGPQSVNEGALLTFTANASDPDPGDQLTFTLLPGAPAGANINPSSGVFSWTPTEAQGPGIYSITVQVSDNGAPLLSTSVSFSATVNEVNSRPLVAAIADQTGAQGCSLSFVVPATDADIPANTLTYRLGPSAPAGTSIDPVTGRFNWEPPNLGTYPFTVEVSDNGSPSLTATQSVTVVVTQGANPWSSSNNVTRMAADSILDFSRGPSSPIVATVDTSNTLHYLFSSAKRTNRNAGGPLFHTFKSPGQSWSPLVQLGATGYVQFVQEDRRSLHVLFEVTQGQGPIWYTRLDLNNLPAGWSPNVNVSQTASNAATQRVLVDTNGTLHLVFVSGPLGAPRLFHAYKRLDQSWSAPVAFSPSNEVAVAPLLLADRSTNLHVVFSAYRNVAGDTYYRVRHATLNINNLAAGWSASTNLNWQPTNTLLRAVLLDEVNTLHVLVLFYTEANSAVVFHRYRKPDGTWSAPIQASQVGTNAYFDTVLEDRRGRLHLFYTAAPSNHIWHSSLDISNLLAGWSANADVSRAATPTGIPAPVVPFLSSSGLLHAAFPTPGNPGSLFHNYLAPGDQWKTPLHVYQSSNLSFATAVGLLAENSDGLQMIFYSFPTNHIQVVHSQLNLDNIGAGWSPAETLASGDGALQSRQLLDRQQRLHLVVMPSSSTDSLVHRSKPPGGPWSCPTPIGQAGQFPRDLLEARDGTLQLFYGSDDQIWHRELVTPLSPKIRSVGFVGTRIQVTTIAISGYDYRLQYKDSLAETQWHDVSGSPTIAQGIVTLEDAAPAAIMRFYRVSLQPVVP